MAVKDHLWVDVSVRAAAYTAVIGTVAAVWTAAIDIPYRLMETRAQAIQTISIEARLQVQRYAHLKCLASFSNSARYAAAFADGQLQTTHKLLGETVETISRASLADVALILQETAYSMASNEMNYAVILQEQRHSMSEKELAKADQACQVL